MTGHHQLVRSSDLQVFILYFYDDVMILLVSVFDSRAVRDTDL